MSDEQTGVDVYIDPVERLPAWIRLLIQALIVYSIVTMAITTMEGIPDSLRSFLEVSEVVVVVLFSIEFVALWVMSKDYWRYPLRFSSLVDLAAILPFYLSTGVDLRGIRVLRLLRLARILKLGRYNRAARMVSEAFRRTAPELAFTASLTGVVLVISAMALYYTEHDAQPEVYSSIPDSLWWAVVTLTTVGYGDVYPVTVAGKCVACVIMLAGIGVIALPTSILSGAFRDLFNELRTQPK